MSNAELMRNPGRRRPRTLTMLATALFLTVVAACDSGGGPLAGDALHRFISEDWVTERAANVAEDAVEVHQLQDDGSFVSFDVVLDLETGRYEVPDAPEGELYVRFLNTGVVTSRREVDFVINVQGRAYETPHSGTLEVEISGLDPWNRASDRLMLYAPNNGAFVYLRQGADLEEGATSATASIAYDSLHAPRIDADEGDYVFVSQQRYTGEPADYYRLIRTAVVDSFSMTSSGTSTLRATLSEPAELAAIEIDWDIPAFRDAVLGQFEVETPRDRQLLGVFAHHGAVDYGMYDATQELGMLWSSTEERRQHQLQYMPPRDRWQPFVQARYVADVFYRPEGHPGASLPVNVLVEDTVDALDGALLTPRVSIPRNIRVNGQDAFADDLYGVTDTPQVTWDPPEIGEPTHYMVGLNRILVGDSPELFHWIFTTDTKMTIPPGILAAGELYAINVVAIDQSCADVTRDPLRLCLPLAAALTVTRAVSP